MAIKKLFKARISSIRFIFKGGVNAIFMDGRYITDVESEIAELMAEIGEVGINKSKHPHLYVDEAEAEFDTEAPTTLDLIKAAAREEGRLAALREMGETAAKATLGGIGSTQTIAALDPSVKNEASTVFVDHDKGASSVSTGTDGATAAAIVPATLSIKPASTVALAAKPAAK